MEQTVKDLTAQIEELTSKANAAIESLDSAKDDSSKLEEVKALIEGWKPEIENLKAQREAAQRDEDFKALTSNVTTLKAAIEDLRKGPEGLFPVDEEGKGLDSNDPYREGSGHSMYADIRMAKNGVAAARERLSYGLKVGEDVTEEGKAMTEGTDSQGGYLVRPQIERQLVQARELDNVLRGLCSSLNVNTTSLQLDQLGISTTAGWVAELATKPESTAMTLASLTASVFTLAGLATISNQLLADSNPAVDGLVTTDLAKRLVALEETAFLNGDGSGKPLGILNTPGITATTLSSTDVVDLLTAILQSIGTVEDAHGAPSAILMHPRTWTRIIVAQLTGDIAPGNFIMGNSGPTFDATSNRTVQHGPTKNLWGYPVVTTNRMPTNLGGGTNESRVIVGDFREALILDRQGITVDDSSHVYFTTNQTVFRAEARVGFTAARTPAAFNIIGGAGLASG